MKLLFTITFVAIGSTLAACSEMETHYFKDRVNIATMERVAKRYGLPHKADRLDGNKTEWIYFDRGSGTSGYSGYARSSFCRLYRLTFDQQEILRDWRQEDCQA